MSSSETYGWRLEERTEDKNTLFPLGWENIRLRVGLHVTMPLESCVSRCRVFDSKTQRHGLDSVQFVLYNQINLSQARY